MKCRRCREECLVEEMTVYSWRREGQQIGTTLFCSKCLPADKQIVVKCSHKEEQEYLLARLEAHGIYRPSLMEEV